MNRLKFYSTNGAAGRRGFTDIIVTDREAHPYARNWWPPGHIIGYEHTFVNTFADFVQAVVVPRPCSTQLPGRRALHGRFGSGGPIERRPEMGRVPSVTPVSCIWRLPPVS
jgi:hypothetical protein